MCEQVEDLRGGEWLAVVVALGDVAAIAGEHGSGGGGFDAFGDGGQAQGVGQVDDRAHDRCDAGILVIEAMNERSSLTSSIGSSLRCVQ